MEKPITRELLEKYAKEELGITDQETIDGFVYNFVFTVLIA